jgi:hypothetical protein
VSRARNTKYVTETQEGCLPSLSEGTKKKQKERSRATEVITTFFAGVKKDYAARIEIYLNVMQQACEQGGVEFTYREMDSAHCIMLEKADEVNRELAAWLEGLGL